MKKQRNANIVDPLDTKAVWTSKAYNVDEKRANKEAAKGKKTQTNLCVKKSN